MTNGCPACIRRPRSGRSAVCWAIWRIWATTRCGEALRRPTSAPPTTGCASSSTAWPRDPKSAREPSNARLRRLAQLPPMRPRGRAWGVWDADRDVWTTGEPDLFGDVDVFMDAWPKSGVMAAGRVYTVPESWLKCPGAGGRFRFGDAEGVRRGEGRPGPGVRERGCAPARAGCGDPRPTGSCTRRSSRTGCSPPRPRRGARWTGARSCPRRCVSLDLPGRMDPEKVREHDSKLPTPRANDANGAGVHGDGAPDLRTAAVMLPTPNALYDSVKAGTAEDAARRRRRGAQLGLADAINLLVGPGAWSASLRMEKSRICRVPLSIGPSGPVSRHSSRIGAILVWKADTRTGIAAAWARPRLVRVFDHMGDHPSMFATIGGRPCSAIPAIS